MLKWIAILACVSGCAVCHIRPDNSFYGAAVGHSYCEKWPDGHVRVEGGAMSNNVVELLGTAATAAGVVYSGGLLP